LKQSKHEQGNTVDVDVEYTKEIIKIHAHYAQLRVRTTRSE